MEPTAAAETAHALPRALEASTLCEAFQLTAADRGDATALRAGPDGEAIAWSELAERVRAVAGGLAALGLKRGDAIGLMLTNRPEFNLVDLAALHLGATPFSVYNTSTPEQVEYLFGNAGNRIVVTEPGFLDVIEATRERSAAIETIVLVEGDAPGATTLADLERSGDPAFDFEAAWRAVEPGDVATLIYTSGTTGPPKGVELTHANLLAEVRTVLDRLPTTPGGVGVSYLPSAHIADRWSAHYQGLIGLGAEIVCIADPRTVAQHLPAIRPTAWGAVPRIWEKIKAALEVQGVTDPSALDEETRAAVRAKLGLDRVENLVGGAAPISVEVLEFFRDLGLPICELWGMSETSCCATLNPTGDIRIGTVGPPLKGVELRLAEDGELLVKSELVMKGYRNDPERTAEAIDADGWLHTGDIAEIDDDGYVKIVDRKKELIINAAGKNMSPANIESRIKTSHALIGQAVAIGDRRPYNVALIVLDPDVSAAFAQEHGLPDSSAAALAEDERVHAAVAAGIEAANSHLSRVEQIKRFKILPTDWEPGGDELTPTMKLKRRPIAEKYAAEIEALYEDA
jgi:long-subunit acyl-CoA synthetase (AMP-forming)